MKDKIFQQLKQKYSNLGLAEEVLKSVAESLEATGIVTDENLETVVAGQGVMLKSYQSSIDKVRTEGVNWKKELDELKGKGGGQKQNPNKDEEPDWFKAYREEQEKKISELTAANEQAKAEKARAERNSLILATAKKLKISQERIDEGFAIADDLDEAGIETYLAKVKKNEVAKRLEEGSSAFTLSNQAENSKELAKEWASTLPDA